MPDISRLFDFTPGAVIASDQVDQELNQLVNTVNALDAANMSPSFAKDVVEPAFSAPLPLLPFATEKIGLTTANAMIAPLGSWNTPFYLDPSRYSAGSRTTQLRIAAALYTNSVAPGVTLTVFLGPATLVSGGAGSQDTFTTSSVVARADFATAAAGSGLHVEGAWVDAPAAGHYGLWIVASGNQAPGSVIFATGFLEMRRT